MDEEKPKSRKKPPSRRLMPVDPDKVQRKFLMALDRESNQILDAGFQKKLDSESSKSLINYLKLLKELRETEMKELGFLNDDELAERAGEKPKKGEIHE